MTHYFYLDRTRFLNLLLKLQPRAASSAHSPQGAGAKMAFSERRGAPAPLVVPE